MHCNAANQIKVIDIVFGDRIKDIDQWYHYAINKNNDPYYII